MADTNEHTVSIAMRTASRTENLIWDAVREAICANWTVEQFRAECAEAWRQAQKNDMEAASADWRKRTTP